MKRRYHSSTASCTANGKGFSRRVGGARLQQIGYRKCCTATDDVVVQGNVEDNIEPTYVKSSSFPREREYIYRWTKPATFICSPARAMAPCILATSNLLKCVWEHREGVAEGFAKKYGVKQLVWFEPHADALSAIAREKQLKKWNRAWKIRLIQQENPYWRDLYEELTANFSTVSRL